MSEEFPDMLPDGEDVFSQKLISQAKQRKFLSQNSSGYVAIAIIDQYEVPVDPEPGSLHLKVYLNKLDGTSTDPKGNLIVDVNDTNGIIRDDVGMFHYDIGPQHTSERGLLTAEWEYGIGDGTTVPTQEFAFVEDMQILNQMPAYEALTDESKLTVERTSWFFADLFDSTAGGPWLQENFQTHFDYERIAQLMYQAIMKLNVIGYPITNYGVTTDSDKIPANFSQLAVWATKLEVIRHLILSYTEQPAYPNATITYTDRRDYCERWREILEEEKPEFEHAAKMMKRGLLSLSRGSLLVGGGIYGGGANQLFLAGTHAALTRSMRFYPAAPSLSWSAQAFGR